MEKVHGHTKMDESTLENLMEKELITGQMEISSLEHSKMINDKTEQPLIYLGILS